MAETENKLMVRTIIEILGKPEKHVTNTIKLLVAKIKGEENMTILKEHISEAKEQDGMYSIFTELELEMKSMEVLMAFTFGYMPSMIEIMEPSELKLNSRNLTNFFTDLQSQLHNLDAQLKVSNQRTKLLLSQLNSMAKNAIIVSLRFTKDKGMGFSDISKISGIAEESLSPLLETLVKEQKVIKMDGNLYKINFDYKEPSKDK